MGPFGDGRWLCVDHAAKFDGEAVGGALDDPALVTAMTGSMRSLRKAVSSRAIEGKARSAGVLIGSGRLHLPFRNYPAGAERLSLTEQKKNITYEPCKLKTLGPRLHACLDAAAPPNDARLC